MVALRCTDDAKVRISVHKNVAHFLIDLYGHSGLNLNYFYEHSRKDVNLRFQVDSEYELDFPQFDRREYRGYDINLEELRRTESICVHTGRKRARPIDLEHEQRRFHSIPVRESVGEYISDLLDSSQWKRQRSDEN